MINEEIVERNKNIAIFMEFEYNKTDSFGNDNYRLPYEYRNIFNCSHYDNLHFNTSYDWLMPVVDKIESMIYFSMDITVEIEHNFCTIFGNFSPIFIDGETLKLTKKEAIFMAVSDFAKRYNERTL
jgi:hypothetical protein